MKETIEAIKVVLLKQLIVDDSVNCIFWACGPMSVSDSDIYIVCNSDNNDVDYQEFDSIDEAIDCFLKRTGHI